jgi:hypothetical protein
MASISHGTLVPERSLAFFIALVAIFPLTGERKFSWRAEETISCSGFVTTLSRHRELRGITAALAAFGQTHGKTTTT